jgi:hypothetical protein
MIVVTEGSRDGGAVVGEAIEIFLDAGLLAGRDPQLALDPEQFFQQCAAPWPRFTLEEIFDAWPDAAALPGLLEAIGKLINPCTITDLGVAHGGSPHTAAVR